MRRFDRTSFIAGAMVTALGTLLLLDQLDELELGFGWTAPAVLVVLGVILVALGRDRGVRGG